MDQQQLVQAYKKGFNLSGAQSRDSDDQIQQKLKQQGITDANAAEQAGRQAGQQQSGQSGQSGGR